MALAHKRASGRLVFGDIAVFIISLWITLAIRYVKVPDGDIFLAHFEPFILLFVVWALVFFIVGLYDRQTLFFRSRIPGKLATGHSANLIIALIFFYAIPYYGIAPKATLFLYLLVSSALLAAWRLMIYPAISKPKPLNAMMIGNGNELIELRDKFSSFAYSGLNFVELLNPEKVQSPEEILRLKKEVIEKDVAVIAIDLRNPAVRPLFASLYDLIFRGIQFIDTHEMYEDLFDREPLGLIDESWFVEHISLTPNVIYDVLKRLMDIVVSLPLAIASLVFYPFVWIATKMQDGGDIFIFQDRVGEHNEPIRIIKFRTMTSVDDGRMQHEKDANQANDKRVTPVGRFLRRSRIDELPQLWNVIKGDVSLIGPRPELPKLVEFYGHEIPYYNVRHLIKPGLSGWAQIHHEVPPHSVEETRVKLAYDLYYLKHRSFFLDLKIGLQTIKTLLSRTGI